MKKFFALSVFLFLAFSMFGQVVTKQIAFGAKGVDSLYGAETKYYYVSAYQPQTAYYVYAIQAMTTRSAAPTGSDSCQITFEISLDNSNWHKFTGTTPKVSGGAVYTILPDMVTTTTNGACMFAPATCYYPYLRVKFQHYVAATTMYPKAYVVLKKY